MRPVDRLPKPARFIHTRLEAIRSLVCARCGADCHLLTGMALDEWLISALCSECFDKIMVPLGDEA